MALMCAEDNKLKTYRIAHHVEAADAQDQPCDESPGKLHQRRYFAK
jgi:hypothetical protein